MQMLQLLSPQQKHVCRENGKNFDWARECPGARPAALAALFREKWKHFDRARERPGARPAALAAATEREVEAFRAGARTAWGPAGRPGSCYVERSGSISSRRANGLGHGRTPWPPLRTEIWIHFEPARERPGARLAAPAAAM